MESIVAGINKLSGVLVITLPDCLLYSAWQESEDDWDAEVTGAYFGQLVASGIDGVRSVDAWRDLWQMTIEFEQGLMVVRPTKSANFAVGYIFERDTPLGWIRRQVDSTYPALAAQLDHLDGSEGESAGEAPADSASEPKKAAPAAKPAEAQTQSKKPAPAAKPQAQSKKPASGEPPTVAGVKMSKAPAKPAEKPAGSGGGSSEGKGSRLIKYLGENTGDTHAALLRVSLQTGLPLTRLREPDKLSEEEYAKVEESVRLILGVDQLDI